MRRKGVSREEKKRIEVNRREGGASTAQQSRARYSQLGRYNASSQTSGESKEVTGQINQ
jgi:hypothetical protein